MTDRQDEKTRDKGPIGQSSFTIGKYTFESFHEYRDAKEDMKKISVIQENLDIQDPETAVRLYRDIRDGRITFLSPIGDEFAAHISDIVAEKSKGLLEEREVKEKGEKRNAGMRYFGIALTAVAAVLFIYFGYEQFQSYRTAKLASDLRGKLQTASSENINTSSFSSSEDIEPTGDGTVTVSDDGTTTRIKNPFGQNDDIDPATLSVLPEYSQLYAENNEFAGWLTIPEAGKPEPWLDLPVMQTQREEGQYYLKRDFYGNDDRNGTLFMDRRCDIVNPTTNTIIYGHNMNSGLMFGGLSDYYESKAFYKAHRDVIFDTIYEHRRYMVVAVCLSDVKYQDDTESFRYYDFTNAENMEEWKEFEANVAEMTMYPEDFDISPGDQLLTLSTCDGYKDNGRLFVVCKRVS